MLCIDLVISQLSLFVNSHPAYKRHLFYLAIDSTIHKRFAKKIPLSGPENFRANIEEQRPKTCKGVFCGSLDLEIERETEF